MADDDEPQIFYIGGEDDLPEELKELLRRITGGAQFLTPDVHKDNAFVDEVRPTDAQLNINVGDYVSVVGVEGEPNDGFAILGQVIDPARYSSEYPDWADRLHNSYLLLDYIMGQSEMVSRGWFPRVKMIPLTEEQYGIYREWSLKGEMPERPPEWLVQSYIDNIKGLNDVNPTFMPFPSKCIKCESDAVYLYTTDYTQSVHFAGEIDDASPEHLKQSFAYGTYSIAGYSYNSKRTSHMVCTSCGYEDDLKERGVDVFTRAHD